MRTIINSFFRNIGRILAYLVFIIIIYLLMLWLGVEPKNLFLDNAYALNSGYSSSSYDVAFVNCGNSTSNPQCGNTWGAWVGRENVGTRIVNPHVNSIAPQTRYSFRLVGSTTYTYIEGNTYTWNIVFSTTSDSYDLLKTYYRLDSLVGNTSTSSDGASSQYFKSYTYSISRDGSSTNRYVLKITFEPNANLRYINAYFYINSTQNRYLAAYGVLGNVTYNSTTITYEQGLTSAIANQNTIISNGFDNLAQISLSNTQNLITSITSSTDETNDLIKDDSIDSNQATSYFTDFDQNNYGIQDIINVPLHYIQRLTTETCQPLNFTLPFVHSNVSLPCMTNIYRTYFNDWFSVYQTLMLGIVCYGVGIKIMKEVRDALNPMSTGRVELIKL